MSHPLNNISKEEIIARIKAVKELDLENAPLEGIKATIGLMMDAYAAKKIPIGLSGAWRARPNKQGHLFKNVEDLWYPPAHITRLGRLNREGSSVFYLSDLPYTAIAELKPAVGSFVTLMRVVPVRLPLIVLPLGLRSSNFAIVDPSMKELIEGLKCEGVYEKWIMLDDLIAELFKEVIEADNQHKYYGTLSIAETHFTAPGIDGLIYKSIASSKENFNLGLEPAKANELFKPEKLITVKIQKDLGFKEVKHSTAITDQGEIIWER